MEAFLDPNVIVAFLTLTFLEIILGIDNIIFISIITGKLPADQQKKATRIGLLLAMFMRIAMLFGITWIISMERAFFHIDWGWLNASITGQSMILFAGGLFLLWKSTKEIHHKVDDRGAEEASVAKKASTSFQSAIFQIILIDMVFSVDSILTAVGMTSGVPNALYIMVTAVVVSVAVMMLFAIPISNFVNRNPSIQILALAFLVLIGFMLITEAAHKSGAVAFGNAIGAIPKGYLYFAIAFSLGVEFLNMKRDKQQA